MRQITHQLNNVLAKIEFDFRVKRFKELKFPNFYSVIQACLRTLFAINVAGIPAVIAGPIRGERIGTRPKGVVRHEPRSQELQRL
jgi:hypothetical protein